MPQREPFDELERFLEKMTRTAESDGHGGVAVDLRDDGDEFVLLADLPGYRKADVDVTVDDRTVTVSAERDSAVQRDDEHYIRRERRHREASRRLTLPAAVDAAAASATYEDGLLTVHLPKRDDEADGTRIDVE
jgi:HSP20 family protein